MLITAAQAELTERYGSGDENPIEPVQFGPPEGGFFVAWQSGTPVACAGWRTIAHVLDGSEVTEYVAELKRMYVVPSARGTGVAALLLAALEDSARECGMPRMILETGGRQPEALRFYPKCGYVQIPNYGYYRNEPDCVSFARDL